MSEKTPEEEALEAWEKGTPIEVKRIRPSTSVLSTRLPLDLFESLSRRAEAEGKSVSLLARELIERALDSEEPQTPLRVASMFQRWLTDSIWDVKIFTSVSPAITRNSWVHFCSGGATFESTLHDLLTEIRSGKVEHSSTAASAEVA